MKVATEGTPGGERGTPNKVHQVVKGSILFVDFTDGNGVKGQAMFFELGGQYYSTKDTVEWCRSLRPMAKWMADLVETQLADKAPSREITADDLPTTDQVDLLATS